MVEENFDKKELTKDIKPSNAWGIASLSTGILSLLFFIMPYFGLPMSIFALVSSSKQKKINNNGLATSGLVLGILGCIFNGIMSFFLLIGLLFLAGASTGAGAL